MPLAAFGGRQDLMNQIAPVGPVYQAGTLSGNPVSVAAGLAALRELRGYPGAFEHLDALGLLAEKRLGAILIETKTRGVINRVGSMLTLFFGVDQVRNFPEAMASNTERFAAYFRGMLAEGMYLPPSQYEAMFFSLAHRVEHVEEFCRAARTVLANT